ncbi:MAG TPA: FAD-dependent oxidoreductase [Burkholderiaceae bacterium]|nr:FAD-dependent oxidoreductase [Burkholderiaceae bacterium]
MHIAVIGAGIAGITTAYELARDGHTVTVLERNDAVAAEASFANAGLISPALLALLPDAGRLRRVFGRAGTDALHWQPRWHGAEWAWLRRWRGDRGGRGGRRRALLRLAEAGRERHQAITQEHQLGHERSGGALVLRRRSGAAAQRWAALLDLGSVGVRIAELDAAGCLRVEPGLCAETALADGLHLPDSLVANCRDFAHQLRLVCERDGAVRFHFQIEVTALHGDGGRPTLRLRPVAGHDGASTARRDPRDSKDARLRRGPGADQIAFLPTAADPPPAELAVDAVVLCSGAESLALAASAGTRLPLLPLWGLGVTFRLRDDLQEQVLRSAVIEAETGITLTRLGQRLRVCGGWQLGGARQAADDPAYEPLYAALDRWFPLATQRAGAQLWRGARPTLPDGLPVVGPSSVPGVWLQMGLGGMGWTLACASARMLADQIAGRPCALDPTPFSARRWQTS